jgi:hypothetical protein
VEQNEQPARIERTGRWLIVAGVSVWLVFAVAWLAGRDPQGAHYLPFHLSGVLPGAVMSRWRTVSGWFRRTR